MAMVIVFHYSKKGLLPALPGEEYRKICLQINEVLKEEKYQNVFFNGTFVDEEGKGGCLWEAPNKELVIEVITKVLGASPPDGAAEVRQVI